MKKRILTAALLLAVAGTFYGCDGNTAENSNVAEKVTEVVTEAETEAVTDEAAVTEGVTEAVTEAVSEDEKPVTAPQEEVGFEGMEAVYASALNDGVYSINVDSSSSMFNITSCELTVENGQMTAAMTMSGKGYLHVFMGTGEEAEKASEDEYIPFAENENGEHVYTVPVEALNFETPCTAFSKKKETWYDRILVFRADSLPADAFADGVFTTAESLGLADGEYTADVVLGGGSGRASVASPAVITVKDGKASARIIWSSRNYDYMIADGEKYFPDEAAEEFSEFDIPVSRFDFAVPVSADTTAMSTPHEIQYTLNFSSASIKEK